MPPCFCAVAVLAGAERQVHRDLGAAVDAALDLEAAGERGNQGQPNPQAGPLDVRARADAHAVVADGDREAVVLGDRSHLERAGAVGRIGVDHDVQRRDDRGVLQYQCVYAGPAERHLVDLATGVTTLVGSRTGQLRGRRASLPSQLYHPNGAVSSVGRAGDF